MLALPPVSQAFAAQDSGAEGDFAMAETTVVTLRLNQQQLELVDRTIRTGVAADRAALIRLALRETAAARRPRPGAKAPA